MSTELEYNLAGCLPFTVSRGEFHRLLGELAESGYQYGCLLPFRALTESGSVDELKKSPMTIVHLEGAWNPTGEDNFRKAILAGLLGYGRRIAHLEGQNPIVQDAFFPSRATCDQLFKHLMIAFPAAKVISYSLDVSCPKDRLLVGVDPVGQGLSLPEISARAEMNGYGLVFDPRHVLSGPSVSLPGQPTRVSSREWESSFQAVKDQVEVVDIHPTSRQDLPDLLKRAGLLKELAVAATEAKVDYLRVEVPIPLMAVAPPLRGKGFDFLEKIGQALQ